MPPAVLRLALIVTDWPGLSEFASCAPVHGGGDGYAADNGRTPVVWGGPSACTACAAQTPK